MKIVAELTKDDGRSTEQSHSMHRPASGNIEVWTGRLTGTKTGGSSYQTSTMGSRRVFSRTSESGGMIRRVVEVVCARDDLKPTDLGSRNRAEVIQTTQIVEVTRNADLSNDCRLFFNPRAFGTSRGP